MPSIGETLYVSSVVLLGVGKSNNVSRLGEADVYCGHLGTVGPFGLRLYARLIK